MSELQAVILTSRGPIQINLFPEHAPITVLNFVNLAERGYYNNLNFHRVIPDFMIQGGCPEGTGTSGPGYQFEDECSVDLMHDKSGLLSMANAGPHTNGSQFFITHTPTPWLDMKHTIFGEVVSEDDQSVVDSIEQGDTIETIQIDGNIDSLKEEYADRLEEWNQILDNR
jgi:peptidyl-prolyl cis-trans isomerase B (cyclophilin B)